MCTSLRTTYQSLTTIVFPQSNALLVCYYVKQYKFQILCDGTTIKTVKYYVDSINQRML